MQLTQELTFHVGNMKFAFTQWKAFRPPKWVTTTFIVAAFVAGWFGGWARGYSEATDHAGYFSAALSSMEANERAIGKPYFADKLHAQNVDRLVHHRIEEMDESVVEKSKRWVSPQYWSLRKHQDAEHAAVVRYAERRLALVPTVQPETREALSKQGQLWQINNQTSWFESTAAEYSRLLGRKITAEQLLPDAYLREQIESVRDAEKGKP